VTALKEAVVALCSSRGGALAACLCFGYGTIKDRKVMLKTMKPNVVELSKHEQGHLVLIRALDVVDDTVRHSLSV
jgi:pumilio family protein 6